MENTWEIVNELARRISVNPSQKLAIIQNFYEELLKNGDRSTANNVMTLRRMICDDVKQLVISLHGIKTRGDWQKALTAELNAADFNHVPLDYGYFPAAFLLIPKIRSKKIKKFREEYTQTLYRFPNATPSIIAHSFGTYITAKAMELYQEIKFDQIIFCGSIVTCEYDWDSRIKNAQVNRILNECGKQDFPVKIVSYAVKDAGPSGIKGFRKKIDRVLYERTNDGFGHSDYFYQLNYQKNWIPFLKNISIPHTSPASSLKYNWRFLLIRLAILLAFIVVVGWYFKWFHW